MNEFCTHLLHKLEGSSREAGSLIDRVFGGTLVYQIISRCARFVGSIRFVSRPRPNVHFLFSSRLPAVTRSSLCWQPQLHPALPPYPLSPRGLSFFRVN